MWRLNRFMNVNKRFSLINVIFVLLPFTIFLYSEQIEKIYKKFNLVDSKSLILSILFIPVISSLYILVDNYRSKNNSLFWNVFQVILLILSFFIYYSINSLSNFGF